jgi:hypothetical protein
MTPEAQRIAIAEACGWKKIRSHWQKKGKAMAFLNESHAHQQLPDYLFDLNAMHEAEKVLNPEQLSEYYIQLASAMFRPFRASAAQRAEALLKALNLWKEASK